MLEQLLIDELNKGIGHNTREHLDGYTFSIYRAVETATGAYAAETGIDSGFFGYYIERANITITYKGKDLIVIKIRKSKGETSRSKSWYNYYTNYYYKDFAIISITENDVEAGIKHIDEIVEQKARERAEQIDRGTEAYLLLKEHFNIADEDKMDDLLFRLYYSRYEIARRLAEKN